MYVFALIRDIVISHQQLRPTQMSELSNVLLIQLLF